MTPPQLIMRGLSAFPLAALFSGALFSLAPAGASPMLFHPAGKGAPYSEAVEVGSVVYLSGKIGSTADGRLPAGMEAQARQAMDNIKTVLARHGLQMRDLFKCTVMLTDMGKWADFNRIYVAYFEAGRLPARSAFGVKELAMGALVEVECIASRPAAR